MFAGIPMLTAPVVAYNLLAFSGGKTHAGQIYGRLADRSAPVGLASGAALSLSLADVILALAIGALVVDVVRWITDAKMSVLDHSLATVVFVTCVAEFMLIPQFGTSTFLLITLMSMLNVAAGVICALAGQGRIGHSFRSGQ